MLYPTYIDFQQNLQSFRGVKFSFKQRKTFVLGMVEKADSQVR